jgi:hypothetical protein
MVSTAVERVAINFNKPDQRWLDRLTVTEAKRYVSIRLGPQGPPALLVLGEDLLQVFQPTMGEGDGLLVAGSMDP